MPSYKWSIRLNEGKAYVFVNGARYSKNNVEYSHILRAEVGTFKNRVAVKLIFNPGADGKRDHCFFSTTKYDWSVSNGLFREIVATENEQQWTVKCNEAIEKLKKEDASKDCQETQGASKDSEPVLINDDAGINLKRKSSSLVEQLSTPLANTKKKCREEDPTKAKELQYQTRAKECEVDGQFYVPVGNIELPPADRMIRKVDEIFLAQLKANMESNPNGSYEPLYLLVKDLNRSEDFSKSDINSYHYEVLGGTHNLLATKQLLEKHPDSKEYKGRYARIFVGLTDVEALWLASRHNKTGCFRHEMTFEDEVKIAHRQLEIIGKTNENNDLVPSQQWRDKCSHILGKTKKNLSDVFLVAALPEDGYQSFLEICQKYEKGLLKEQRAMAKDLQEKPRFKPSYIKCLFGLDISDRVALLGQVAGQSISLDELKLLCKELKVLQPVQKVISSFLGCKWESLSAKLGEKVSVDQLRKFTGKDETNLIFRQYLDYLQKSLASEKDEEPNQLPSVVSPNIFMMDQGTKGIVHICIDPLQLQQGSYGQEKGFKLALYKVSPHQDDVTTLAANLLDLMDRVNFGVCHVFNVAMLGDIDQLTEIKKWITEHRGMCELGFACVNGVKTSGPCFGMVKAVEGFLVYHAAPGQRVLEDHFNLTAGTEDFIIVNAEEKELEVCSSVVEMFSRPGDWILDVNTPQVAGAAAAMKAGRNVLCLRPDGHEDQARNALRKISLNCK